MEGVRRDGRRGESGDHLTFHVFPAGQRGGYGWVDRASGREEPRYAGDPRAAAIAEAARRLVEFRDRWLNLRNTARTASGGAPGTMIELRVTPSLNYLGAVYCVPGGRSLEQILATGQATEFY